jgi:hypothetical protein
VAAYEKDLRPFGHKFSLPLGNFTQQMDALVSLGYITISPEQFVAWLNGNSAGLPAKPILSYHL